MSQPSDKRISGFLLRDIEILQAFVIPDATEKIEIQLTLRPRSNKASRQLAEHRNGIFSVDAILASEVE